jgi:hypothetical protein
MKRIFLNLVLAVVVALSAPLAYAKDQTRSFATSLKLHAKAYGYILFLRLENWMARQGMILGVNTITNLIPTLYEALDQVSREMVGFIPAVSRNSNVERAALNQSVNIFIAPPIVGGNVTPGATPPSDGDAVIGNTIMTISKSRYWPVRWNGEEQRAVSQSGQLQNVIRDQFAQAFRAAVNEIEVDLAALYVSISRYYGAAATVPFGNAADFSDFAQTLRILDDNGAPISDRQLVLGGGAIANLRGKQNVLFKANEAGTTDLLRLGILGMVEGYAIHNSAAVKTHVAGTAAAYTTDAAGYAVGATSLTLITGTGTLLPGDAITFAGDTNIYTVSVGLAAPGVVVIAEPGLRVAMSAATKALTLIATCPRAMAFSRSAIALTTRAPALPETGDMADDRTMVVDPVSGLGFEVSMYRQYRQVKWEVACAWGVKAIAPRHIAGLLG